MVNFWKLAYEEVKAERDTLISDLPWYKAKVSRLEQRKSKLVSENTKLQNDLFSEQLVQDESDDIIKRLERENKDLMIESDKYNKVIKHIRDMSFEKPNSYNYRILVKFINELEGI